MAAIQPIRLRRGWATMTVTVPIHWTTFVRLRIGTAIARLACAVLNCHYRMEVKED